MKEIISPNLSPLEEKKRELLNANVIGATGLVGKQLVTQLLEDEAFGKVRVFVRRDTHLKHPKLEQQIVDFSKADEWEKLLTGDVLFSALRTMFWFRRSAPMQNRAFFIPG